MNDKNGFSLIELLLVVSLTAILLALAAPSFQALVADNRMSTQINTLVTALHMARSEAVKTGRAVTICSAANGAPNASTEWKTGWLVQTGSACANPLASGEREVLREGVLSGLSKLTASAAALTYRGNGLLSSGVSTTFVFCDSRGAADAKAVEVTATGHVRTIAKNPDGTDLSCS
jgi:type IV fimbrial biogenesis protein FimT